MPQDAQNRKQKIKEAKKENELRWYKSKFIEQEPKFAPLKKEGQIAYKLNKSTTVFAPPGTDIEYLKEKYGIYK